jgi:hypothetical protein
MKTRSHWSRRTVGGVVAADFLAVLFAQLNRWHPANRPESYRCCSLTEMGRDGLYVSKSGYSPTRFFLLPRAVLLRVLLDLVIFRISFVSFKRGEGIESILSATNLGLKEK